MLGVLYVVCGALILGTPPASSDEPTLLAALQPHGKIKSVEIYHLPDHSTYRARWTWRNLIASPDVPDDYLRIGIYAPAVHDLSGALAATKVAQTTTCKELGEIDVRWAVVIHFEEGSRSVLSFNMYYNCVQLDTGSFPIHVGPELYDFIKRDFGALIY
jgi:hypothetical protein